MSQMKVHARLPGWSQDSPWSEEAGAVLKPGLWVVGSTQEATGRLVPTEVPGKEKLGDQGWEGLSVKEVLAHSWDGKMKVWLRCPNCCPPTHSPDDTCMMEGGQHPFRGSMEGLSQAVCGPYLEPMLPCFCTQHLHVVHMVPSCKT